MQVHTRTTWYLSSVHDMYFEQLDSLDDSTHSPLKWSPNQDIVRYSEAVFVTSDWFKIGSTLASKMADSFAGFQDARGAIGREMCQIREFDSQRMMQALAQDGGNEQTSPTIVHVLGERFDLRIPGHIHCLN